MVRNGSPARTSGHSTVDWSARTRAHWTGEPRKLCSVRWHWIRSISDYPALVCANPWAPSSILARRTAAAVRSWRPSRNWRWRTGSGTAWTEWSCTEAAESLKVKAKPGSASTKYNICFPIFPLGVTLWYPPADVMEAQKVRRQLQPLRPTHNFSHYGPAFTAEVGTCLSTLIVPHATTFVVGRNSGQNNSSARIWKRSCNEATNYLVF